MEHKQHWSWWMGGGEGEIVESDKCKLILLPIEQSSKLVVSCWLVDWLSSWLAGWLAGLLVGCLVGQAVCKEKDSNEESDGTEQNRIEIGCFCSCYTRPLLQGAHTRQLESQKRMKESFQTKSSNSIQLPTTATAKLKSSLVASRARHVKSVATDHTYTYMRSVEKSFQRWKAKFPFS